MKMDKIKLGVIGAGRIGKIHIENIYSLNENIEINGVVTNNEETINWLENEDVIMSGEVKLIFKGSFYCD